MDRDLEGVGISDRDRTEASRRNATSIEDIRNRQRDAIIRLEGEIGRLQAKRAQVVRAQMALIQEDYPTARRILRETLMKWPMS